MQAERKRLRKKSGLDDGGIGGSAGGGIFGSADGGVGGSADGGVVADGAECDDDDDDDNDDHDDDVIAGDTGGSYREPFKWAGDLHR